NRREHDWPEAFDRVVVVDDVPNLDQIGFLFGQFPHELSCLIRRVDFDDWRIAKIKFFARDTRDQWAGHRHAWRSGRLIRSFADLEIPKWSANIDDTCD